MEWRAWCESRSVCPAHKELLKVYECTQRKQTNITREKMLEHASSSAPCRGKTIGCPPSIGSSWSKIAASLAAHEPPIDQHSPAPPGSTASALLRMPCRGTRRRWVLKGDVRCLFHRGARTGGACSHFSLGLVFQTMYLWRCVSLFQAAVLLHCFIVAVNLIISSAQSFQPARPCAF